MMYYKNAVVAKLISDKVDFRTMNTVMNKEGHYHIIMLSILTKRTKQF